MEDILSLFQHGAEVFQILVHIHLGGLGLRPLRHTAIKLLKGHGLSQVVRIPFAVQEVVEADVGNIPAGHMLPGQIRRGAAAKHVTGHGSHSPFKSSRRAGRRRAAAL